MDGANKQDLPPWEHRQLVAVPYLTTEPQDEKTHHRQGSSHTLPGLTTDSFDPTPDTTNKQRGKSFWNKSTTADTPAVSNTSAPYETPLDTPYRRNSLEPSSALTSSTSTPEYPRAMHALSGTMSSRAKQPRWKQRPRQELPSQDESSKGEGFASAFKGIFTSSTKSTTKPALQFEKIRTNHWTEDEY